MLKKYITLLTTVAIFGYAQLPQAIEDIIYKAKASKENLAILITNKKSGEVVASLNPYKAFTPASVAKVATCYAALLEFGKDFRWPTQVFYNGKIKRGVLYGDLVIKAYGDPSITSYNLSLFAKKLASYGIREIKGDLIIDRSFFVNSKTISSGFDKNYVSQYNSMPDAIMLNDHLNTIQVKPNGNKIEVYRANNDKSFKVINKIQAVSGVCKGKNAWPKVRYLKQNDSIAVSLEGTMSTKCKPFSISKVLSKPYASFYYVFSNFLNKNGVKFNGSLKLQETPKGSKLFFTHYSKPLLKIIAHTLKRSDNLYARHLFLMLGAKKYGKPATLAKSQKAIKEILGSRDLLSDSDFIVNGSGLSRKTKLSAISVHKIMDDAYNKYGNDWLNALSIAGVDGTLKKRFAHSPVKKRAFMKTGTLKKAKNIAGFVFGKSGNMYNTEIFYNGAKIWLGKSIQDKIITWLVIKK